MAAEHNELKCISNGLDAFIQQTLRQNDILADDNSMSSEGSSSSSTSSWQPAKPSLKRKEKENESKGLFAIMEVIDKLVVLEDALDGIKTRVDDKQWTRDATQALDIDKRLPRDDVRFQSTQMLCRCLTRLASVYHAIETKLEDKRALSQSLLADLASQVAEIMQQHQYMLSPDPIDSLPKPSSYFHDVEQAFNLKLVETLRQANLLTGIDTQKKAEKLLFHCKNLYSVLRPARTVVTVTKAQRQNGEPIYLKTVNRPITKKTPQQRQALESLRVVGRAEDRDGKTLHRSMPIAMQEISALFYPKLLDDRTMLPAQARKFIAHTVKNGWDVVETLSEQNPLRVAELVPCQNSEGQACVLRYRRSGSPAPTATIPEQELLDATRESILQIQNMTADEGATPELCIFNLMTRIDYQYQKQAIDVERWFAGDAEARFKGNAAVLSNLGLVVAPTAFHGKVHSPIVSQSAQTMFDLETAGLPNFTMESAIGMVSGYAAKVLHKGHAKVGGRDIHVLIHCASGQDRTHTAIVRLLGDWFGAYLRQQFATTALGSGAESFAGYEQAFVRLFITGNVGPFLNSIMVPGAPGLKSDSKDASIIPLAEEDKKRAVLGQLYLKSASRNKQNSLPKNVLTDVLLKREQGQTAFLNTMRALLDTVNKTRLDVSLQDHWQVMKDAALQAATGRFSDKEAKSLRDGIYRIVMLFKPYVNKAATPDDMALIARELCDIAKTFRKEYYRPAVNILGVVVMSVGIALASAALASLCLAFIPGSPLLLALGISASLLAKVSLIAAAAGLVATGIGAGVFGGERSIRFYNHFSSTLEKQANIMAPQQSEQEEKDPIAASSDDEAPNIAPT